jgi:hypothetical protein
MAKPIGEMIGLRSGQTLPNAYAEAKDQAVVAFRGTKALADEAQDFIRHYMKKQPLAIAIVAPAAGFLLAKMVRPRVP